MKSLRLSRGFTLIEVMIVIVISIILLSLVLPAYQQYKRDQTFDNSTPPPITSDTVPFRESYYCDRGFLIKSNGQPHTIDGNAIKC